MMDQAYIWLLTLLGMVVVATWLWQTIALMGVV